MNIIKPQFYYDDFKREFPINILIENYKEKVLTKTKFKLGLDCLSKLFFFGCSWFRRSQTMFD